MAATISNFEILIESIMVLKMISSLPEMMLIFQAKKCSLHSHFVANHWLDSEAVLHMGNL